MSILSVDNISPIGSGTSVTINSAATLVLNNVNSTGVATATTFVGALTGTASGNPTLANGSNNRVITATGANALTGESTLLFDGNLIIDSDSGHLQIGDDQDLDIYHNGSNGYIKNGTGQLLTRSGTHTFENAAGSTEYARIDSSGRTLIGTTSQNNNARLQVTTDQQVVATFEGTGSSDPQIYLGDDMSSPTDNCIILGYDKADNRGYLTVGGDGDDVFTITNGGAIGINNSSPDNLFKLDVNGGVRIGNNVDGIIIENAGSNANVSNAVSIRRHASTGNLHITAGTSAARNLIFGTKTNGGEIARFTDTGLCFNGDTAAANALDDYEEGTYTPTNHAGTATLTNNTTARYRKIGQMVYVQFDVSISSSDGGTNAGMTMPFASSIAYGSGVAGWTTLGRPVFMHISGAYAYFMDNSTSGSSSQHLVFNETNGNRFIGSFWYIFG